MAFFKLLTGGHVYAPDDLGTQNILIAADIVVFDDSWQVDTVLAKGEIYVQDGKLIKGGFFDKV